MSAASFALGLAAGLGIAALGLVWLSYYLDRREQTADMRRRAQMTAVLAKTATPRPPATGGVIKADDAGRIGMRVGSRVVDEAVIAEAIRGINRRRAAEGMRPTYLPEPRDADFQP